MMKRDVRIVLKPGVTRDAIGSVGSWHDWWLLSVGREDEKYIRDEWRTSDGETFITYLEDPVVRLPYIVVRGPLAESVGQVIRESLQVWSIEEAEDLLAHAESSSDKVNAIYFLALSSSEENESVVSALERMSHDNDPRVRRAVVIGIGYLAWWPALRTLLETIRSHDLDEGVRRDAGYVLADLDLPDF
ncbi:MAG TPA: hypothetical protein VFU43_30135 [Streptosporangiaceae bacterium]|nr:hypothetical protein [Streptosporangiaceae bacterium]